jgi:hypothetical protein
VSVASAGPLAACFAISAMRGSSVLPSIVVFGPAIDWMTPDGRAKIRRVMKV